MNKNLEKVVAKHFTIPKQIHAMAMLATRDLYFGPNVQDEDYPGFATAIKHVKTWAQNNIPSTLWVDMDCEQCLESEPDYGFEDEETGEFVEYYMENTYHLDSYRDILKCIFDSELVFYL
jgi:hypothetical protein